MAIWDLFTEEEIVKLDELREEFLPQSYNLSTKKFRNYLSELKNKYVEPIPDTLKTPCMRCGELTISASGVCEICIKELFNETIEAKKNKSKEIYKKIVEDDAFYWACLPIEKAREVAENFTPSWKLTRREISALREIFKKIYRTVFPVNNRKAETTYCIVCGKELPKKQQLGLCEDCKNHLYEYGYVKAMYPGDAPEIIINQRKAKVYEDEKRLTEDDFPLKKAR